MKLTRYCYLIIFCISLLFFMGCFATIPTNQAPVIISDPVTFVLAGKSYAYQVEAIDTKGDKLTYSLTSKPPGMTIDSSVGTITWESPIVGTYDITVEVSDGELSDIQSYTLTVGVTFIEIRM
jgi:hypothetical protein